jgi:hypothetical protein
MKVISSIYQKLSKEVLLFSTMAVAGVVYFMRRVYKTRRNKKFYNKDKKNLIRKFNLLFNDVNKTTVVQNNELVKYDDCISRLKNYCEKMHNEVKKISGSEKYEKGLDSKKDKLFFYIFNNMSHTLIQKK